MAQDLVLRFRRRRPLACAGAGSPSWVRQAPAWAAGDAWRRRAPACLAPAGFPPPRAERSAPSAPTRSARRWARRCAAAPPRRLLGGHGRLGPAASWLAAAVAASGTAAAGTGTGGVTATASRIAGRGVGGEPARARAASAASRRRRRPRWTGRARDGRRRPRDGTRRPALLRPVRARAQLADDASRGPAEHVADAQDPREREDRAQQKPPAPRFGATKPVTIGDGVARAAPVDGRLRFRRRGADHQRRRRGRRPPKCGRGPDGASSVMPDVISWTRPARTTCPPRGPSPVVLTMPLVSSRRWRWRQAVAARERSSHAFSSVGPPSGTGAQHARRQPASRRPPQRRWAPGAAFMTMADTAAHADRAGRFERRL